MVKVKAFNQIREIYDGLPTIECKGLCHESCGPIICSSAETELIEKSGAVAPSVANIKSDGSCTHLQINRKCAIYDRRPLICRLFGVAEGLECPFGCKPSRILSKKEAAVVIQKMESI